MHKILTTSAQIFCQHSGRAILSSSQHDIFANGKQILLQTDVHKIIPGTCSLTSTSTPPCVKIKWSQGSLYSYSKNERAKLLTEHSIGKCYDSNGVFKGLAIIRSQGQQKVLSNG